MSGNADGQEIVEELDALTLMSPTASDDGFREPNFMSPRSTDWSRALGWAGGSPFQSHTIPYEERPNSPERRSWSHSSRQGPADGMLPTIVASSSQEQRT